MISKMPKIQTLRKHFPDCDLSDERMLEISEWLRGYLGQQHITPNNKLLKVLMAFDNEKQWNKDVFGDIKQIKSCMVCPSTDDVKRYKTNIDGTFYANGGDGYVEYCKKHAKEHGYTDEHLHKTHK